MFDILIMLWRGMSNFKSLGLVDGEDSQYPEELRTRRRRLWGLVKVEYQLSREAIVGVIQLALGKELAVAVVMCKKECTRG